MHIQSAAITCHSTATCACALPQPLRGSPPHQLLPCLLCWVVQAAQQPPLLLPLLLPRPLPMAAEGEAAQGALLALPRVVRAGCRLRILFLPPLAAADGLFQPPQIRPLLLALALPPLPQVVGARATTAALLALPMSQQARQLADLGRAGEGGCEGGPPGCCGEPRVAGVSGLRCSACCCWGMAPRCKALC